MTKLIQTTSLASLILLFSGCSQLNNLNTPEVPKIDENLEMIDNSSVKSISDITSIAFEWKRVNDPNVVGYNFYRANMHKDGRRLKLIDRINSRYVTHYVDTELEPNTKYVYQISSRGANGFESKTTDAHVAQTADRARPVSFIQAIPNLPNKIKLVWRPHPDLRIEYYEIQKLDKNENKWKTIEKLKGRLQSEFIDDNLGNNKTFTYRIIAYTFHDIATQPSKIVTAKTKPLPIGAQNLTATINQPKKIVVTWQPSPTEDVIKYQILRSPIKSFGFTKVIEVGKDTLEFEDKINDDGKEYYYKVISYDKDHLLSSSKVEPVRGQTLTKPAKPVMTLAQIQGNKAILNWTAADNRAMSYNVYKRTKLNFWEYKTEKFTDIDALRFEDNNIINGVEYKYSIQSNDEYGLMSEKTDEAELILPKIQK